VAQESSPGRARVVHRLPERTRLRLPSSHRQSDTMRQLQTAMSSVPGVRGVETNSDTGSVLLYHEPDGAHPHRIGETLQATTGLALDWEPPQQERPVEGRPLADGVKGTAAALDRKLAEATGGRVDLRILVPVALAGAAMMQIVAIGGELGAIPPYLLLYWAFDTFTRFNTAPAGQSSAG
jgi:hypothetical protein